MPAASLAYDKKILFSRMKRLGVSQKNVVEKVIRASVPGGQGVNKVSNCVYLKHIPTGIEVKCQLQRSQAANRFVAWDLLLRKIEQKTLSLALFKKQELEKVRRQTRPRSRNAKLKVIQDKRKRSQKKSLRGGIASWSAIE